MRVEMVMPQMGESIAEATILKWLKNVGDNVKKDETILEISTDKVDSEIPAPASGVLSELRAQVGEVVAVKSVIAVIDTDGTSSKSATPAAAKPSAPAAAPTPPPAQQAAAPVATREPVGTPSGVSDRFYSPLVRSLATENGISDSELATIKGSGAEGRVTKSDVMAFLQGRSTGAAPKKAASALSRSESAAPPAIEFGPDGLRVETMDNMRKKIAEHMVRSKATSPHVYSVAEVDVSNIAQWREQKQPDFVAREGFKLSFTPFFLEAVVKALVQFPHVNASVDGDKITLKRAVNLGCAVALGTSGLIVPVIKNADQLSFVGIARSLNELANKARNKKLQPDDIQGGTFTVTNPGVFGNILGYPIINQPQLGIIGVGAIKKRPVVVNNMIAIRDIVYLTLTYDHRVIDGSLGGQFLQFVAKYLENWDTERELY